MREGKAGGANYDSLWHNSTLKVLKKIFFFLKLLKIKDVLRKYVSPITFSNVV